MRYGVVDVDREIGALLGHDLIDGRTVAGVDLAADIGPDRLDVLFGAGKLLLRLLLLLLERLGAGSQSRVGLLAGKGRDRRLEGVCFRLQLVHQRLLPVLERCHLRLELRRGGPAGIALAIDAIGINDDDGSGRSALRLGCSGRRCRDGYGRKHKDFTHLELCSYIE